jgi:flagellar biosynthesis protein FlhG
VAEQAERLRLWVRDQARDATREVLGRRLSGPHVLAVTSGKGGVGKSNIALALGIAMARKGVRTAVLDADLGLANINILLGYEPKRSLWDVMEGRCELKDVLIPGPEGLLLIAGASGLAEAAAADAMSVGRLVSQFRQLDAYVDWLIVDTGAGIAPGVLAFVVAADSALIVTIPEPTALADAYGLVKAVNGELSPVRLLLTVNRALDPVRGLRVGERLSELALKALGQPVEVLGTVAEDSVVGRAVMQQKPFNLARPTSAASLDVERLANRMLGRIPPPRRGGLGEFVRRVMALRQSLADTPSEGEVAEVVDLPRGLSLPPQETGVEAVSPHEFAGSVPAFAARKGDPIS